MKHHNEVMHTEPLQGFGLAVCISCVYLCIFTPFTLAGYLLQHKVARIILFVADCMAMFVLAIDLASAPLLRLFSPTRRNPPKFSLFRRFRMNFKLKIARWVNKHLHLELTMPWPKLDALILTSFILEVAGGNRLGRSSDRPGLSLWQAAALVRLAAIPRVVYYVRCAENHAFLSPRKYGQNEYLRRHITNLVVALFYTIHLAACLWCITARAELGPSVVVAEPTEFFPQAEFLNGESTFWLFYLSTVNWGLGNLTGIGGQDSTETTSIQNLLTISTRLGGAVIFAIITGQVVTLIGYTTAEHDKNRKQLLALSDAMGDGEVPEDIQGRAMQAAIMNTVLVRKNKTGNKDAIRCKVPPELLSILPKHLGKTVLTHTRAAALALNTFSGSYAKDFTLAIASSLTDQVNLLVGDFLWKMGDEIDHCVFMIEDGTLDLVVDGRSVVTLGPGDVLGKRWLAFQTSHEDKVETRFSYWSLLSYSRQGADAMEERRMTSVSVRAMTPCGLWKGLSNVQDIHMIHQMFPEDISRLQKELNNSDQPWV
jgi:hypothetical protein